MWADFKKFLMRGNILDMAVGIAVGSAFTAVVKSLVADIIMPPIGLLLGNVDFANLFVILKQGDPGGPYASLAAATEAGAQTWRYGQFVNTVFTFLVVALSIFLLVRAVNRMRDASKKEKPAPPAAPTTKKCPFCQTEIHIDATRCPACTSELGG